MMIRVKREEGQSNPGWRRSEEILNGQPSDIRTLLVKNEVTSVNDIGLSGLEITYLSQRPKQQWC